MSTALRIKDRPPFQKLRYRARALKYARRIDPCEIRFVRKLLNAGDLAIDIGAHKGGYVYWLQRAVTPTGRVLAFEPQPRLAEYLRELTDMFGFDHVEVIPRAVSSVTGSRRLFMPGHRTSTGATLVEGLFAENDAVVEIEATTLDDYLVQRDDLGPPRYIKIDVETHELDVLRGSSGVLSDAKPVVQLEADQHVYGERSISEVFDFVGKLGFDGFFFFRRKLWPLERFDLATHQPAALRETPNHTAFANNFLFLDAHKDAEILRRYGLAG